MRDMTPTQIVCELDQFIIGQSDAKRAVAVAIRNRWRRQQLSPEIRQDILPKNIIMIGPTGVGKTEIARRLANLTGAPFIKVEASKFTEVGYHGRDVESMIRDLVESAIGMVRVEHAEQVRVKATAAAEDRLLDILLPPTPMPVPDPGQPQSPAAASNDHTRERLREQLAEGKLDDREVEIQLSHKPATSVMFGSMGVEQMDSDMANMFERILPEQTRTLKVPISEARKILEDQETEKLIDRDKLNDEAIRRAEQSGIIFLDEIDKIAVPGAKGADGSGGRGGSPDVSREGVQRDLLPIVEGSTVTTRYGTVHTDHILFIAAGAFHYTTVNDLMPELQGRFPIRVELSALVKEDFIRILTEPSNALTKQQKALLEVEGLVIEFEDSAVDTVADLAAQANLSLENVGARRLMTIMEKVFEELNFDAPQLVADGKKSMTITEDYVRQRVLPTLADEDLSKFLL